MMQVLMPPTWYFHGFASLALQRVHWENDDIVVSLMSPTHAVDPPIHEFWDEVSADAVGPGPTTITNRLVDVTVDSIELKGDAVSIPQTSDNFAYIVIYDNTPSLDSEKPLLGVIDLGETFEPNNEVVDIQWGEGIVFQGIT